MRQEFKYLISNNKEDLLRNLISPYVIRDDYIAIKQDSDYTVRSIYFDTLHLDEYHKKIAGVYSRKKIRVRGYIHHAFNDMIFLEIKRKINMEQKKDRSPIRYSKIGEFFTSPNFTDMVLQRNDFPDAIKNATYFLYYIKRYNMVPVVLVIYEREAYINKFDHSLRVTFDKNLRCIPYPSINTIFSDDGAKIVFRNKFILEVKSNNGFPNWMTPIINKIDVKREALSKYALSIDKNLDVLNTFSTTQMIAKSQLIYNNY